jgi:N-acylneuraminate cytidylyltransferase
MIVIIPARGGSKRIPGKNIKLFKDKPVILQVISILKSIKDITRIIVSTDDFEIASLVKSEGVEVPFMRSPSLSGDLVDTISVIKNAITEVEVSSDEIVLCVYPTSVFIDEKLITEAKKRVESNPSNFVFCAKKFKHPIQRSFQINDSNEIILEKELNSRTQDHPSYFHDAAQIYAARSEIWLTSKQIISRSAIVIDLSSEISMDIDNLEDWAVAELLYDLKNSS